MLKESGLVNILHAHNKKIEVRKNRERINKDGILLSYKKKVSVIDDIERKKRKYYECSTYSRTKKLSFYQDCLTFFLFYKYFLEVQNAC